MSYKPILFNTKMVQAIMSGSKTETRRKPEFDKDGVRFACIYNVGDILYVRETFNDDKSDEVIYRADYDEDFSKSISWKASLHMSKKYARIFLKVTDVYLQKLQNMIYEDLDAEGFYTGEHHIATDTIKAKKNFAKVWDSTLKKSDLDTYSYDANPYVWVIKFKKCKKPSDWKEQWQ